MAFSKTLNAEEQDIYVFQYRATKSGMVYKFWRQIIERMSKELKTEVRTKPTYLVLINSEEKIYEFVTRKPSDELRDYLKAFKVKL